MAVTTYALWDALKHMYAPWRLESTIAQNNPAWMRARKTTDGGGTDYSFYIEYSIPNRSATFLNAKTNAGRVRHGKFSLTFADDCAVVQMEEKLLAGSNTDAKAIRNTLKAQTDGVLTALNLSAGRNMFSDGSGSLGTISSTTNLATTTLGVTNAQDIINFHVGQILVFAASTTSALRSATGRTITAIDETAGTMTLDSAPSLMAAGIATGDTIFTDGDYISASDRLSFRGFGAWIPTAAAFTAAPTLFSQNRSVDRTGLAGYAFSDATTYAGYNEDDAVQLLAEHIGRGGGNIDVCYMNPYRVRRLINAIGSSEQFTKSVPFTASGKVMATLGYTGVAVATPAGIVECVADRNCPRDTIFCGDSSKVEIVSIGSCPHWAGPMAQEGRPMESSLAREFRLVAWPQMGIRRPKSWGRFDWT